MPPVSRASAYTQSLSQNDTVLPTGSPKDQNNSVGLSVGKELGFTTAAVMSTGNAAASVAAYSAAAGLKSVVLVPRHAPSKIIQARAYGATVIVERNFDYEVAKLYKAAIQEFGWYDCLSSNPIAMRKEILRVRVRRPTRRSDSGLGNPSNGRRDRDLRHVERIQGIPVTGLDRAGA
jgi:threonine synthase